MKLRVDMEHRQQFHGRFDERTGGGRNGRGKRVSRASQSELVQSERKLRGNIPKLSGDSLEYGV